MVIINGEASPHRTELSLEINVLHQSVGRSHAPCSGSGVFLAPNSDPCRPAVHLTMAVSAKFADSKLRFLPTTTKAFSNPHQLRFYRPGKQSCVAVPVLLRNAALSVLQVNVIVAPSDYEVDCVNA